MSKKEHETPVDPEAKTTPKEKKSASKRKWYWIIIIILVLVLIAVVAFGIVRMNGRKSSSKNSAGNAKTTTTVTTTHVDVTDPGSPLTYSDFSFGGRTVKGYKNFIDLCEKEGGSHSYYFSDAGTYCKNANRGVDIGDDVLDDHNSVKDAFGEADVESEIEDEAMPDWSNDPQCRGFHYIYSFSYHGHTYKKIIFVVVGAAWAGVSGIEYVVE